MRLDPASSATSWNVANRRVTPGSASEVTARDHRGPYSWRSTRAPACETTLCAPGYAGSAGVVARLDQSGTPSVAGLPSSPARRIAVIGRQIR